MKKLICVLLALTMLCALCACGGGETPSGGDQPGGEPSQSQSGGEQPTGYVFSYGGHTVAVDDDMADVLAALGEPKSYFEAESCAFNGLDKTYTYSGFIITTRPDGDKDYVSSILLTDDSVTTPEGLYIGSSAEQVKAAYGESESVMDTLLSYADANGHLLHFVLEQGKVISIEYLAEG